VSLLASKEPAQSAQFITDEIRSFTRTSPLNRLPEYDGDVIFDEPLVNFADGNDPIFTDYKSIIDSTHLTPREALAEACGKKPEDLPARLSIISWILPITLKTRQTNRQETVIPSRPWSYTRWYGEKFNDAAREHVVELLRNSGYLATAPSLQPYFKTMTNEKGRYSNWSERHIAYAAGLGTFSLSDGFISERGIALRCGSVVTDLVLPPSPRTTRDHLSNCLFYVNKKCHACIPRCPAGAITENGHDKIRCDEYLNSDIAYLKKEYGVEIQGCGLCQTKVPCEFRNPAGKLNA
jgi:epoxyqueuosine reductase QueG